ncbi:MAG: hypothetical protein K8R54_01340 [Bacteroidales bacterium]|nr:hypothetical protein [Bacteroidales bacterium]
MPLQFGCNKDKLLLQEAEEQAIAEAEISGTSAESLQAYVDQLIEEGVSEEEVTRELQEYIEAHNSDAKSVNYTYTVSGVDIGSWMLLSKNTTDRAEWLDAGIYEPITNMWKDKVSTSSSKALSRISKHLSGEGFNLSAMHTSAYYGYINETYKYNAYNLYTWTDDYWYKDNNHGRIFGPVKVGDYWITLGAFSREKGISHDFINFYEARNKAAGYSSYFPSSQSVYSGNTWEDGYSYVKVRIRN